ncbi:hypothetical protein [Klebsiella variicola]|uniref:hypothetical protein n=1 Tax=Klebsiella variicola TaxID=244366 RepID=UPI0018898486|nr:hypothetical protein [Klebsiella variicola]HCA9738782.1 hypothetical protein [Klebsiella variicola subsp. variicola]MDR6271323.1 hypothetical protein [Klebsiella variicola]NRG09265.1 hypothetical protein [Klebsiella variicola]HCI6649995.1 hypothetical protein [Klebsiella variicola subsp. variicola]HCI9594239.1 hypothetical protein [Klebsiella variicola]
MFSQVCKTLYLCVSLYIREYETHIKWADFLVSKTPVNPNNRDTDLSFIIHKDNGATVGEGRMASLAEINFLMAIGKTFVLIYKQPDGQWRKDKRLSKDNLYKLFDSVN